MRVTVDRVAESCGYGVPLMEYAGERPHAPKHVENRLRIGGERRRATPGRVGRLTLDMRA